MLAAARKPSYSTKASGFALNVKLCGIDIKVGLVGGGEYLNGKSMRKKGMPEALRQSPAL